MQSLMFRGQDQKKKKKKKKNQKKEKKKEVMVILLAQTRTTLRWSSFNITLVSVSWHP